MAISDILLRLGIVLLLVLLNGFFVAAEFSFVRVRGSQLEERVARGDKRARSAKYVLEHLDRYLSATQVGITLTSLALGWLGEPVVAEIVRRPLEAAGLGTPAIVHTVSFALGFAIITFFHITVGELVPKNFAISRAEGTSRYAAGPIRIFYQVFKPFIWLVNKSSNAMLALMGAKPASEGELIGSEEELRIMLAQAGKKRVLPQHRADFLIRFFELQDLQARHVMTPRMRIVALDALRSFEDNMAVAEDAGYSRFPVIEGDMERVVGMVHYRDLVNVSRRPKRDLIAIKRSVLFVPESQSAEDLLAQMLRRGIHMAIVTDEFGSTAGLVTLEDIFEELFGEIRDEFDTHEVEQMYKDLGDGHFVLDGLTPLHRASAILQEPLEDSDVTTLSGYVVAQLGRLPTKGEHIKLGRYEGLVRDVDRRRIQTVELWPRQDVADDEEATTEREA
ncbi:MAG TPA: hemolysin family protein [Candidatus Thermoplasmatota archaeon]|nr:hemolysin family protein [Candidatus Thermoplasmatota archaeon]